jgi:hypothetical protein
MKQQKLTEAAKTMNARDLRVRTLTSINSKLIGKEDDCELSVMRSDVPDGYSIIQKSEMSMLVLEQGLSSKEVQAFLDGYLCAL